MEFVFSNLNTIDLLFLCNQVTAFILCRRHWMLAVINPRLSIIYWLDPLQGEIRDDFKEFCEV